MYIWTGNVTAADITMTATVHYSPVESNKPVIWMGTAHIVNTSWSDTAVLETDIGVLLILAVRPYSDVIHLDFEGSGPPMGELAAAMGIQ